MDDLEFYILFRNILVISRLLEVDNEKLSVVKCHLGSDVILPPARLEPIQVCDPKYLGALTTVPNKVLFSRNSWLATERTILTWVLTSLIWVKVCISPLEECFSTWVCLHCW